jgi:hypothetical protein
LAKYSASSLFAVNSTKQGGTEKSASSLFAVNSTKQGGTEKRHYTSSVTDGPGVAEKWIGARFGRMNQK